MRLPVGKRAAYTGHLKEMPEQMTDQIRKGRKFDQVLEGARTVFIKDGFEGASVDDISRTAGVSKATLYNYFPDKRLLFAEVARLESLRQAEQTMASIDRALPPREVLSTIGRRIIEYLTSDLGRNTISLCAAESGRFPELGRLFYESGPGLVREKLSEYLTEAVENGYLEISDPLLAADQFSELCKARIFPCILCGVQTEFSQQELDHILEDAVGMFLAYYGTAKA